MSDSNSSDKLNLWQIPGLTKDEIYATAYFIEKAQFQQNPNDEYWMTEINPEDELINLFLNRLAILFARFKNERAKTQEHVTATGLIISELANGGDNRTRSVYIAKNNGLDEKDQDLIKDLNAWLRVDSPYLDRSEPRHDNLVWVKILKFWSDRIRYYVNELPKLLLKLDEVDKFLDSWKKNPLIHPIALGWEEKTLHSAAKSKIDHN